MKRIKNWFTNMLGKQWFYDLCIAIAILLFLSIVVFIANKYGTYAEYYATH